LNSRLSSVAHRRPTLEIWERSELRIQARDDGFSRSWNMRWSWGLFVWSDGLGVVEDNLEEEARKTSLRACCLSVKWPLLDLQRRQVLEFELSAHVVLVFILLDSLRFLASTRVSCGLDLGFPETGNYSCLAIVSLFAGRVSCVHGLLEPRHYWVYSGLELLS
jgi:hypothetical protein